MTIIVADTTSGLPRKLLDERCIPLIPQIVTFGEESYHDDKGLDTLEYLAKGGRIGGAKKLLAALLEIKPILQVKDGQIEAFEQQRTKKRALARLVETVAESCQGGDEAHLCVLQVEAEKEAASLVEELKSNVPVENIPIFELPPAIVVHAGPKAMGVGFFV